MNPSSAAPRKRLIASSGRRWMSSFLAMCWFASLYWHASQCLLRSECRADPVHILLLNEYFPPDTSATAKFIAPVAEALSVNHRVTVLAGRPSYDPSEIHPRYLLRREVRGNLVIERVGSTAYPRFQMHHRVSNYLTYLSLAIPRALSIPSDMVLAMT